MQLRPVHHTAADEPELGGVNLRDMTHFGGELEVFVVAAFISAGAIRDLGDMFRDLKEQEEE